MSTHKRRVEVTDDAINPSKIAVTLTATAGRNEYAETMRLTEGEAENVWSELGAFLDARRPSAVASLEHRTLITHPHDGHAEGETCLECVASPETEGNN